MNAKPREPGVRYEFGNKMYSSDSPADMERLREAKRRSGIKGRWILAGIYLAMLSILVGSAIIGMSK